MRKSERLVVEKKRFALQSSDEISREMVRRAGGIERKGASHATPGKTLFQARRI